MGRGFFGSGVACLAVACGCALAALADEPKPAADAFFEKEVRPLLVEKCQKCHSGEKPKGALRLDSRANVLKGGDTGPAAVAGQPEESLLVQAIGYADEPRMPPKEKLSDREIATLTRWVKLGLPWPEAPVETRSATAPSALNAPSRFTEEQRRFWSFQPLKQVQPPAVKETSWTRSDIDRFILAALEAKSLAPAEPADKRTLIRRVTFDLTGLPPTTQDVDAFLCDDSPEAFARVVDRLLASPRYGERWGRHWLDLVRYADSRDARDVGSPADITEAWRYRDWVVSAFNRDLPYDQFIRDQIAGDLQPAARSDEINADGLVATGLLTIGEWGTGDADKEKMITDIVDDQIDVVGRVFLGLTLACARCHDHKFDPIPTADYYGLAGIFFSTHILPEPGAKTAGSPLLRTPLVSRAKLAEIERHKSRVAELEKHLSAAMESHSAAFARSLVPETARYLLAAWDYAHPAEATAPVLDSFAAGQGLHAFALRQWVGYLGWSEGRLMTRSVRDLSGKAGLHVWKGEPDCPSLTLNTTNQAVSLQTFKLPARSVSVHPGPSSGVAVAWRSPVSGSVQVSGRLADGDPAGGDGVGWVVRQRGRSNRALASGDIGNGGSQALDEGQGADRLQDVAVHEGDTLLLIVLPKAHHTCDTTTLDFRIRRTDGSAEWNLGADVLADAGKNNPHADRQGHEQVWQFLDMSDGVRFPSSSPAASPLSAWLATAEEVAAGQSSRDALEAAAQAVQRALDLPQASGSLAHLKADLVSPKGPFWARATDDLPAQSRAELTRLRRDLETLKQGAPPPPPLALAAQEGGVPKSAHAGLGDARIHIRGNYARLGEKVPRHFPRILAGDDQPPITQGSGRAELAHWIARAENPLTARVMVNRIWQYHFGAGLVRSPSNFGKLGTPPSNPELLDYLARQFIASGWSVKALHRAILLSATYQQSSRASAEAVRLDPENRLFGRMNRQRLESEEIRDSLLAVANRLDLAEGGPAVRDFNEPRRTLYLITIRSDRSSVGPLFDAADATAVVDTRTVSTVAPQALFLLNHPFVLDCARRLAQQVRAAPLGDDAARIRWLYLRLFARPPGEEEMQIGLNSVGAEQQTAPEAAARAWEAYCQVLLCTNEFFYID